jgi:AraC family transcriptional regulator, transcriptional activator FtrA
MKHRKLSLGVKPDDALDTEQRRVADLPIYERILPTRPNTVAIVVFDGLTIFEFAAACEIFDPLPEVPDFYRLILCSPSHRPVNGRLGVRVAATHGLAALGQADTIVVPPKVGGEPAPQAVLDALRGAHRRGARILSLCTGAFTLAAAGLLDGRRATTHWRHTDRLARQFPNVQVDPDVLYIDDGDILTSAGSTASIDLCLHVVRKDFGADVAAMVARGLVVPLQRQGGQAQYIETPIPDIPGRDPFSAALAWAQGHLGEALSVEVLASKAAMSPRTFARRFRSATGTTPHQWVTAQRVQLAQRVLETTDLSVDVVAERSGFGSAANLRQHFSRLLHTNPNGYRQSFGLRAS